MTEALACTQQALLTYLLEVLIVDDTPRVRHQKSTADELEIWKYSNWQKQQEKKLTEGKRRCSHKKHL